MSEVKKGATDQTFYFKLVDSTAGTPETGLTITNLDITYVRARAAAVKADATALAAVTSAHGDNQAIEVDATNAPGLYRVDFPDAAFATGVDRVILVVTCTGVDPAMMEIELVDNVEADTYARLGAPAGASVSADVAAIKTETASILTDTAEIGAAGAGLTVLATAANLATVDTVVDAIKAKTDSLTFTVAGQVDANVQSINDVAITGNGQVGTEFGV